jgi:hydrogenase maturation protease
MSRRSVWNNWTAKVMGAAPTPVLVVGLGNPILTDDGAGWRVLHLLRQTLLDDPGRARGLAPARLEEACVGGLALAEMLIGYRRAVIIDAIMTAGGMPGTVVHLRLPNMPGTLNTASTHDTNLPTALQALRRFGAEVPDDDDIEIVAVEVQDVWTFGEQCTPAVEQAIPAAASVVLRLLAQ